LIELTSFEILFLVPSFYLGSKPPFARRTFMQKGLFKC